MIDRDIADTLVVFKEDPCLKESYTDEPLQFLWLVGQKIDPKDNIVYILRDVIGYEWEIPKSKIGEFKEYDWLKQCYPRILHYIDSKG